MGWGVPQAKPAQGWPFASSLPQGYVELESSCLILQGSAGVSWFKASFIIAKSTSTEPSARKVPIHFARGTKGTEPDLSSQVGIWLQGGEHSDILKDATKRFELSFLRGNVVFTEVTTGQWRNKEELVLPWRGRSLSSEHLCPPQGRFLMLKRMLQHFPKKKKTNHIPDWLERKRKVVFS